MPLKDIEVFSFEKNGFKAAGIKGPIVWQHNGNIASPICYLRKPKHVPQELWEEFISKVTIVIDRR